MMMMMVFFCFFLLHPRKTLICGKVSLVNTPPSSAPPFSLSLSVCLGAPAVFCIPAGLVTLLFGSESRSPEV
ncbi:hypothetical protein LY76DRAFT_597288 [Colletotrichum caudatum]|nr:hypothetical protein LY76DRAFT_597288 [Colletotrichum caudatum]